MFHNIPNQKKLAEYGYCNLKRIGQGAFCYVYSADTIKNNRHPVAIKIILHTNRGVEEGNLLKKINHEFILKYYEHIFIDKHAHIVTELCEFSDLEELLRAREVLYEPCVKTIISHMAQALEYLKYEKICHFDIKPKNILMTAQPNLIYKLCDFGLASTYAKGQTKNHSLASCGTHIYMAPERFYKLDSDFACDIWSLGISMYQCLFDKPNFLGTVKKNEIFELMNSNDFLAIPREEDLSENCCNLLKNVLKFNPKLRPTPIEILNHEFLTTSIIPNGLRDCLIEKLCNKALLQEMSNQIHGSIKSYQKAQFLLQNHLVFVKDDTRKIKEINNLNTDFTKCINKLKSELGKNNLQLTYPYPHKYDDLRKLFGNHEAGLFAIERAIVGEKLLSDNEYWAALEVLDESLALFHTILQKEKRYSDEDLLNTNINRLENVVEQLRNIFYEDSE